MDFPQTQTQGQDSSEVIMQNMIARQIVGKHKIYTVRKGQEFILRLQNSTHFSLCQVSWKRAAIEDWKGLHLDKRTFGTDANSSEFSSVLNHSA